MPLPYSFAPDEDSVSRCSEQINIALYTTYYNAVIIFDRGPERRGYKTDITRVYVRKRTRTRPKRINSLVESQLSRLNTLDSFRCRIPIYIYIYIIYLYTSLFIVPTCTPNETRTGFAVDFFFLVRARLVAGRLRVKRRTPNTSETNVAKKKKINE